MKLLLHHQIRLCVIFGYLTRSDGQVGLTQGPNPIFLDALRKGNTFIAHLQRRNQNIALQAWRQAQCQEIIIKTTSIT